MTTPAAQVAADVLLLHHGRVGPALRQLERLPQLIHDEVDAAFFEGQRALARQITGADAKPRRPAAPKRHEWLAERIADPELRERAKATLRLDDALLDAIAAGGVSLSPGGWRKLKRERGG